MSQTNFNKLYSLNPKILGCSFTNLMLDNDTVVLFGTAFHLDYGHNQGLLTLRLDTIGNILDFQFYQDSTNDQFTSGPGSDIIKTRDDSYALLGSTLNNFSLVFLKLSKTGEIKFRKKYPFPYNARLYKIIELSDGFLLGGFSHRFSSTYKALLVKVDTLGNLMWQKEYGNPNSNELLGSLVKFDNNRIVIGVSSFSNEGIPINQSWKKSVIYNVDDSGVVINKWESDLNFESGTQSLHKLKDGWIYISYYHKVIDGNEFAGIKLIRRKFDFELVWDKIIKDNIAPLEYISELEMDAEGNWIACGNLNSILPPHNGQAYLGGGTFKCTDNGDLVWSRVDTFFSYPGCDTPHGLNGLAILGSGSSIVAGYIDHICQQPFRSFGWVLKISKDGCIIDTLCNLTDLLNFDHSYYLKRVFPNPASEKVVFEFTDQYYNSEIELLIYDLYGQIVHMDVLNNEIKQYVWSSRSQPKGIYYFQLIGKGGNLIDSGKIIID